MAYLIGKFMNPREYFAVRTDNQVYRKEGNPTKGMDVQTTKFRNKMFIYKPAYIKWYDAYNYGMNLMSRVDMQVFIDRVNSYIRHCIKVHDEKVHERKLKREAAEVEPIDNKMRREVWLRTTHDSDKLNREIVDDLLTIFDGNILNVKIRGKKLSEKSLIVELSLRSCDYTTMHKWVNENVKSINQFVFRLLHEKFGNAIKMFKVTDIIHLRTGLIYYRLDPKPEFIDAIKSALEQ